MMAGAGPSIGIKGEKKNKGFLMLLSFVEKNLQERWERVYHFRTDESF